MNVAILSGNMAKDAEIKTSDGKKVARFSIAVRRPGSDKTDFFKIVAWDKRAEFIENGMKDGRYLSGCEVEVKGQFHNVSFDSTDPQTHAVTKVKYDELTAEETYSHRHKNWQGQQGPGAQGYPQQGNYQQPQRGGYQPQGSYQQPSAPQPPQGGYQVPPQAVYQAPQPMQQAPQGGYQAATQPPHGTYQATPPAPPVQTGSFQQISAQSAPTQSGGFKAEAINAPRAEQPAYAGGYPEGAGYGN